VSRGTDPLDPSDDNPGGEDPRFIGGACAGCNSGTTPTSAFGIAGLLGLLLLRRRRQ
jgi:MYXO-CTERM domain-containing protein